MGFYSQIVYYLSNRLHQIVLCKLFDHGRAESKLVVYVVMGVGRPVDEDCETLEGFIDDDI